MAYEKMLSKRLIAIHLRLQQFTLRFVFRAGKLNQLADLLSRLAGVEAHRLDGSRVRDEAPTWLRVTAITRAKTRLDIEAEKKSDTKATKKFKSNNISKKRKRSLQTGKGDPTKFKTRKHNHTGVVKTSKNPADHQNASDADTDEKQPTVEKLLLLDKTATEIAIMQRQDTSLSPYIRIAEARSKGQEPTETDLQLVPKIFLDESSLLLDEDNCLFSLIGLSSKKSSRIKTKNARSEKPGGLPSADAYLRVGAEGLLCVPYEMVDAVLHAAHDSAVGGHRALRQTTASIRAAGLWWPSISKDIRLWISSCTDCAAVRGKVHKLEGVQDWAVPTQPRQHWQVDAVGPFGSRRRGSSATSGERFLLVAIDKFSGYVELRATTDITAETTARFIFEDIILRHGRPEIIQTDNGKNFIAKLIQEMFRLQGIRSSHSTAYHPQTNGKVERFNGVIVDILRIYCRGNPTIWPQFIQVAAGIIRHTPGQSGFAPSEVHFGIRCASILSVRNKPQAGQANSSSLSLSERHQLFLSQLWNKYEAFCQLFMEAKALDRDAILTALKKRSTAAVRTWSVGDIVRVFRPRRNKLDRPWKGPYKINEVKGRALHLLDLQHPHRPVLVANVSNVKPWISVSPKEVEREGSMDGFWEIDDILRYEEADGIPGYWIRWLGFSSKADQWIPEKDLHAPQLLASFKMRQGKSGVPLEDVLDSSASEHDVGIE